MSAASPSPIQYRPRTIYVSSESVNYYASSERVTISFREPVTPEEGFHLAYGLNSIGMNSTVMNISQQQGNNQLQFNLVYSTQRTTKLRKPSAITPGAYYIDDTPLLNEINQSFPSLVEYKVIIPDGLYTLDQLFAYLSSVIIPSGYYLDLDVDPSDVMNIVPISLDWKITPYGYTITIRVNPKNDAFRYLYENNTSYYFFTPQLVGLEIVPVETSPLLYNRLFTNYNNDSPSTPISSHPALPRRGLNPPNGIQFSFDTLDAEYFPDQFYNVFVKELGNESTYDVRGGINPLPDKINYHNYMSFYKPSLHPVYVDINISLPNYAISEGGFTNKLARIFTLGSKMGNESFFQAWSNPKMTTLEGLSGFSSITIEFQAQDELWNFFNMEFCLEIFVCEYKTEEQDYTLSKDFSMPPTDIISNESAKVGTPPIHPFPQGVFPYRSKEVQTHKRTRFH